MITSQKKTSCQLGCWALALGIALVTTICCLFFGEMSLTGAIFLGIAALFVSAAMLNWLICRPLPPLDRIVEGEEATESTGQSFKGAAAQAAETTSPPTGSGFKPSTPLAGEAELASRKGTWRYGVSDTAVDSAPAKTEPKIALKAAASREEVGTAPKKLDGPRGGEADDLKRIKGIGPKLEKICHSLGFFHFGQVANWSDDEVAWVDANLEGFKGRATRDQWVAQAKELAKG